MQSVRTVRSVPAVSASVVARTAPHASTSAAVVSARRAGAACSARTRVPRVSSASTARASVTASGAPSVTPSLASVSVRPAGLEGTVPARVRSLSTAKTVIRWVKL